MPAPDYAVEIAALESALAAGELKVESDGDMVWYKSAADILAQLNYFRMKAAAALSPINRGTSVGVFNRE